MWRIRPYSVAGYPLVADPFSKRVIAHRRATAGLAGDYDARGERSSDSDLSPDLAQLPGDTGMSGSSGVLGG